ncbi:hypothetical protein VKT23_013903 [Stygiomarasmius scandens]|uniref:Uncharacterized protein n=1 Tax=Marasmiellus scandens TaxID=2682957 RepID=A0ABR1J4T1_9AGAR
MKILSLFSSITTLYVSTAFGSLVPSVPNVELRQNTPGLYAHLLSNLTCAMQDNEFITFFLVDTIAECQAHCDETNFCVMFNTYHDNNGKDGSPLLTCSLFQVHCQAFPQFCTNTGGQTQPDGSVNFITDSDEREKNLRAHMCMFCCHDRNQLISGFLPLRPLSSAYAFTRKTPRSRLYDLDALKNTTARPIQ